MSAPITVNGTPEPLAAASVAALLAERGIVPGTKGVAVARNGALVRAADWPAVAIEPGDSIEIVRPFAGG